MSVGRTTPEQLDQILIPADADVPFMRSFKAPSAKYADDVRRRYPKIPRRVSGYNLDELSPERGFKF